MSDWEFALNTFRLPNTQEGVGLLRTCIHVEYPTLRVQGEFPWEAVIYERGPEAQIKWYEPPKGSLATGLIPAGFCTCWKVRARAVSNEPYCAVSINNILEPIGLWIPSTAEVIANLGIFFCGERGTIQLIEKKDASMERRSVCAMAKHN